MSPPPSCRLGHRARLSEDVSEAVELSGEEPLEEHSSCMTIQPEADDELVKALAEREAANAELRRELTEKSAQVESKDEEIAEIRTTVQKLEAFIESQNAELVTELRRHAGKIAGLERSGTGAAPETALAGLLGGNQHRLSPRGGGERFGERNDRLDRNGSRRGGRVANSNSLSPRRNGAGNGNAGSPNLRQRADGAGRGGSPRGGHSSEMHSNSGGPLRGVPHHSRLLGLSRRPPTSS